MQNILKLFSFLNTATCRIRNSEVIYFSVVPPEQLLSSGCETPELIINNMNS